MRKTIIIMLLLMIFFTGSNMLIYYKTNYKINKNQQSNINTQQTLEVYMNSFTKCFQNQNKISINWVSHLNKNFTEEKGIILIYYFTKYNCKSCVEKIIIEIEDLLSKQFYCQVGVLTDNEHAEYINLLSRVFKNSDIKFGVLNSTFVPNNECFFLIDAEGRCSNLFFPEKDHFHSIQYYLNRVNSNFFDAKNKNFN